MMVRCEENGAMVQVQMDDNERRNQPREGLGEKGEPSKESRRASDEDKGRRGSSES